jgi:hypothetical protein
MMSRTTTTVPTPIYILLHSTRRSRRHTARRPARLVESCRSEASRSVHLIRTHTDESDLASAHAVHVLRRWGRARTVVKRSHGSARQRINLNGQWLGLDSDGRVARRRHDNWHRRGMLGHTRLPHRRRVTRAAKPRATQPSWQDPVKGTISLRVFPAVSSVVFGGRESVGEGDGERVQRWFPAHGPSCPARAGRVQ